MILPIFLLFFKIKRFALNSSIKAKIITSGIDVATPKTAGKIKPYELESTVGISQTKNSTNIVGQKAKEKLAPNKNEPTIPSFIMIGIRKDNRFTNLSFTIPISTSPVTISSGPINLLNIGK